MKILLFWLIILIFLYLFLIRPRMRRPDGAPFLHCCFAHRGLHDIERGIPENSLPAFQRAVDAGFGIELDVQLSSDNVPVVFHDATLSRMCAIDRRVDSLSFDSLEELSLANTGEKIPSFSEVLSLVNGKVPLLIEIKMDRIDLHIPEKINELLAGYSGAYCIESFHPAALWWYRKNRPDIYRGQLSTHFNVENHTLSVPQYLLGKMVLNFIGRPDFIAYNWRFRKDLSLFLCCKLFGSRSAGWVIRSDKELKTCRKYFDMYIFEDFIP
ncbi:MAG: glycerophosphodiester phosphodiesterase family protein [Eubacteriales bacterium]|nr:glycerophosphodiester phosphodiesterase family protein [Eubacteriales bacterium]